MSDYLDYTGLQEYDSQIKSYIAAQGGGGGGSVTGVKGDAESTYRTGNVNITPANIGTIPIANGGTGGTTATEARKNLKYATATATKSSSTTTATTNTKITLNSITSSDSSIFSISSGGIKCALAGTVLVSASMYENNIASGNGGFACRIMNGSNLVGAELVAPFTTSSLMATVTAAPRAITVAANDIIYLYHRSTKAGTIPANAAYLTVQYIA